MSKILELKNQNQDLNLSIIDVLSGILPKSKYVELTLNLLKNKYKDVNKDEMIEMIKMNYGVDEEKLTDKSSVSLYYTYRILDYYFSNSEFTSILKFIEFNEKKCIENNDLTTYKTFEDLSLQLSIAELKQLDRSLEKQVIKLYEDDEWLVLKPLTWESSKKYGANTKWCTSSEYDEEYFYKYARNGILIYYLNKKTGNKTASFRDMRSDGELSFWNIKDKRIDSIESGLPSHIMDVFKKECLNFIETNWDLMSVDEQTTVLLMMESRNLKKVRYDEPAITAVDTPVIPIENRRQVEELIREVRDEAAEEFYSETEQRG